MSLNDKLQRLKSHLLVGESNSSNKQVCNRTEQKSLSHSETLNKNERDEKSVLFAEEWGRLNAQPYWFDGEYAIVRELKFPLTYVHGKYELGDVHDVVQSWNRKRIEHPLSTYVKPTALDAEELIFFDTETTGLGGGVGNTIFLLGYAKIKNSFVHVKQFFLPHPHAEVAMYQAFLSDVIQLKNLVTFNGKAFDWPQVKTRHTLIREQVPKLPAFGHFDLLHASRRLWKHELPSCRLAIIEEQKLGFQREDDVPGHMAPMLYFNYLQQQNPCMIEGILEHNVDDVLSLVSLYIHVSSLILQDANDTNSRLQPQLTSRETYEIGRWFDALNNEHKAISFYGKICNKHFIKPHEKQGLHTNEQLFDQAQLALGIVYKKQKQFVKAKQCFENACLGLLEGDLQRKTIGYTSTVIANDLAGSSVQLQALLELAKLYEHQYKDNDEALRYAQTAYTYGARILTNNKQKLLTEIKNRVDRLNKKCVPLKQKRQSYEQSDTEHKTLFSWE